MKVFELNLSTDKVLNTDDLLKYMDLLKVPSFRGVFVCVAMFVSVAMLERGAMFVCGTTCATVRVCCDVRVRCDVRACVRAHARSRSFPRRHVSAPWRKHGEKCCVDGCVSNYTPSKAKNTCLKAKNDQKNGDRKSVSVFSFPSKLKSREERLRWIKAIPYWSEERDDGTKENSVVCIKHWPDNLPTK